MAKNDVLQRNNQRPVLGKGELIPVSSVVQISNLTVAGPYPGDFQIVNGGRLILGEDPDSGPRVILSSYGAYGYNALGVNTFSLWTSNVGGHTGGDFHLGNLARNFLLFDDSSGELGLYTPQGAGFIARQDGTLQAGLAVGAHLLWNAADEALQIRHGDTVKISLGADGNASFDGMLYASGGRIYGTMAVDDVLRAGDVDGPAVYMGRFQRDIGTDLVETAEIIATDENNLPWLHVVAGGESLPGYFRLGGTGDYDQHLSYDGVTLELDGTVHARSGSFTGSIAAASGVIGGWTINADNLQSADLAVKLSAAGGIVLDSLIGLYDSAGIKWSHGGTDHFRLGIELDEGVVTWAVIESSGVLKVRGDGIVIAPYDGHSLVLGNSGIDTTNQISLSATTIAVNGTLTWKPITNSTTALQLQNAAGTAIMTFDTTNTRVGVGRAPTTAKFEFGQTSGSTEQTLTFYDGAGNPKTTFFSNGEMNLFADPATAGSAAKNSPSIQWFPAIWSGGASTHVDSFSLVAMTFTENTSGHGAFWFRNADRSVTPLAIAYGSHGQVAVGDPYSSYFTRAYGQFTVLNTDASNPIATFRQASSQSAMSFQVLSSGGAEVFGISASGLLTSTLSDAATSSVSSVVTLGHNSSGTPANGYGSRIAWNLQSSTTADQEATYLDVDWADATHATRSARVKIYTIYQAAPVEVAKFGGTSGNVFNEDGSSWCDFRIEGDTTTNLFFADASADAVGIGTDAPVTRLHVRQTSGDTSSSRNLLSMGHNSTGTPAAGFGAGILLALKSDTTADREAGLIEAAWSTATDASRKADLILSAYDTAKREGLRIQGNGAAAAIGLYGAAPVVQATTSVVAASFAANSGTAINDASTFDGYTIKQIVKALRLLGALA